MPIPPTRPIDYLRISITDRCNERCLYCTPQGFSDFHPSRDLLSDDDIVAVVRAAVGMGFRRFRVTGGEPLVRPGVIDLVRRMAGVPGVETLGMTTNATLLAPAARALRSAGLESINISLDALTPSLYRRITRQEIGPALQGIEEALAAGFRRVKLNTVLMRHVNEEEVEPIAGLLT